MEPAELEDESSAEVEKILAEITVTPITNHP